MISVYRMVVYLKNMYLQCKQTKLWIEESFFILNIVLDIEINK